MANGKKFNLSEALGGVKASVPQVSSPVSSEVSAPPPVQAIAPPPVQAIAPPPVQAIAPPPVQAIAPPPEGQPDPIFSQSNMFTPAPMFPSAPSQFQAPVPMSPAGKPLVPPVISGKLGQIYVSRYPVERYKAAEKRTDRIAIVDDDVKVSIYHYKKGVGPFYCFKGMCCDREGLPQVRYAMPMIQYSVDPSGRPTSTKFTFYYLFLSEEQYLAMVQLNNNVPVNSIDFLVTCSDEHYQKIIYQNIGPNLWRQNPSMMNAVIAEFNAKWPKVDIAVARVVGPEIYEDQED